MSNKGSSDLDVFNGLAKKMPSAPPAPSSARQSSAGPPPIKGRTLVGLPTPPVPSKAGSIAPPPPSRRSGPPALPGSGAATGTSPSGPPPPPPSRVPTGAGGPPPPTSVEMDWDDDDEQTTVYDKGGNEDAARALLEGAHPAPPLPAAGAPAAARPSFPAPTASRPPPTPPPTRPANRAPPQVIAPPPARTIPPKLSPVPAPAAIPDFRPARKTGLIWGVLGAALVAVLVFFLWPKTGSLIVTVAGPGGKPLDQVEVILNGEQKCSSSPCTISGLQADTYMLRASAPGYQRMADEAIAIKANSKTVRNLTLVRAMGTGIKVIAEGSGLNLYVDGKEVGPLPQELKDMEPGPHVIKVAGNDRYQEYEQTTTVEPEQMQTIGPLKLKVLKGLAKIVPGEGADGARVLLVSGSDRRALPKLPINLDIPTDRPHELVASRAGYETLTLPIEFEDGEAERTFEIEMTESSGGGRARAPASRTPTTRSPAVGARQPAPPVSPPPAPAGGSATLNINSIPVSNIILDGKPLGSTPKVGVRVPAGTHTVVFVSGAKRKVASINVPGGQTKTVAVRF